MKITVPLRQYPPDAPLNLFTGRNGFRGSTIIPPNIFLSHVIIRNDLQDTVVGVNYLWEFDRCIIAVKYRPNDKFHVLYSGSISSGDEFLSPNFLSGDIDTNLLLPGDRITLATPIPKDSEEPKF